MEQQIEDGSSPSLRCCKLYGRQEELDILQSAINDCLTSAGDETLIEGDIKSTAESSSDNVKSSSFQQQQQQQQQQKSFIFIEGTSGAGKTSLVEESVLLRGIRTKKDKKSTCIYGYGKFEAKKTAPFVAIGNMLADIAAKLLQPISKNLTDDPGYNAYRHILKSLNHIFDRFDKDTLINLEHRLGTIFALDDSFFDIDTTCATMSTQSSGHNDSTILSSGNGSGAFSIISEASLTSDQVLISMSTGLEEVKNLLRIFIRTIAITIPIVLVADDLQFMDESNFELLKYILEDTETMNIVFIGLYRDGQSIAGFTTEWIHRIDESNKAIDVTYLNLDNLSLPSVEELLSDTMNLDNEDVEKLAILLHDRTEGNPFFINQLLENLQERKLIRYEYNNHTFRWMWDESEIRESTMMVADAEKLHLFVDRLRQLPERVQFYLQSAAYIGSRFESRFLQAVMTAIPENSIENNLSCEQELNIATQQRLVEETTQPGIHRFTHDQVYETALNLQAASQIERQELHLKIGRALVMEFSVINAMYDFSKIENSVLFVCTDQLNMGRDLLAKPFKVSTSDEYREETNLLVRLNLEAGKRCATSLNAYTSSREYLELGSTFLKRFSENAWEESPELMLEFHTLLSEVYLCCGEPEKVPSLVHEALSQLAQLYVDTFRIRYAHLQALHSNNMIDELVDETLLLLDELGERFHKETKDKIVSAKRKSILRRLDSLKDEDIMSLGRLTDRRRKRAMQLLVHVLSNVQYFSKYQGLTKVTQLRLLEMTLDYGICKFSANSFVFASYALFDEKSKPLFDASMRVAKLGIQIAKKIGQTDWKNNILPDGLVFRHWTEPYVANVDDSLFQYENNLKHGRIDSAFQSVSLYIYTYYFSGLDLRPLLKDMEAMCSVQWQYGARLRVLHMLPLYQLVLNLVGQSNDILDMYNGDAMFYRTILGWGGEKGRDGEIAQWSYSLHLYVYCEEWEKATDMYVKLIDKDIGILRSFPMWHCRVFFFALVAMRNARKSKGLKHMHFRRQVKKHVDLIRMWVSERKAINLVHKLNLLEAVELTLKRQYPSDETLVNAFNGAIVNAIKAGFFQDAALAACHAARAVKDPVKQLDYACLAQREYKKWGAKGVAKYLARTSQLHNQAAGHNAQVVSEQFMGAWRGKERLRSSSARILPDLLL